MENTIEFNGKTYTREEVQEAISNLATAFRRAIHAIARGIKSFGVFLYTVFSKVKQYRKQSRIDKFEKMSEGKSNNWRKIHGLALRRA
jgi:hypothetical protein